MLTKIRKLPLLFILVAGISILFLAFTYDHQKKVSAESYAYAYRERQKDLEVFAKLGQNLGRKQLFDELNQALEEARLQGRIDFYLLQNQGHTLWFGEKNGDLEHIDIVWPITKEVMATNQMSFRSVDVGDGFQLTVGLEVATDEYVAKDSSKILLQIWQEGMFTILIVLVVGIWALRDLMLMGREVRRGKKAELSKISLRSSESELFARGLRGYAKAVTDLEDEKRRLGRQVLPSLQKEIYSGRQPPYDFECTMVRTDINHFSTIFNTHNVTEFMATVNDFFEEVSHIVARYGGLVHEFVGDEVIYYFKDDEHRNSFAIALSAIRDINEVADRFHTSLLSTRGYPFTVKSSVAHGSVRFGPLVNGFTIAGSVLIETVRILAQILDKDENVVFFDGLNASRINGVIESQERLQVKMKGYLNEVSLHQYLAHRALKDILEDLSLKTVDQLHFYRSDEDLRTILQDLQYKSNLRPLETTLRAVSVLRAPHVARAHTSLAPDLRSWIAALSAKTASAVDEGHAKILSAVVKLYINLVPAIDFGTDDRQVLGALMQNPDRRVVANSVEVLTHFNIDDKTLQPKIGKGLRDDLRIAANSLVLEGRHELTNAVLKKLKTRLKSKKANELASGLYALGELALIHRSADFAYYSAQIEFQSMIGQLDTWAQHTTTMVRRQALIAARKAADGPVIERIRRQVRDSGSELLAEELKRYLETSSPDIQKSSVA